jgi:NADPH-dependent 2,4-dienoyl-CoA reductase/sulfur reductase-like enzyme
VTRHVIVGGGIAGLSAAEALRAADPRADITLVGGERHPFYSRPGLAYLLAGEIPERQLTIRTAAELRELMLDRIVDDVTAVDTAAHTVTLARHDPLRYDRLLLATGAAAVPPDFPGADLDGVLQLDDLDGARRIVEHARRARTAVVVGGGPTAIELAEGLAARGLTVHYLLRGARYWAGVLDPVESRLVEEALERDGVVIHRHTRVARAIARGGRLGAVETASGVTIECDLVAVAIGVRPRLALARGAGLAVDRGVLVDEHLASSAPDVFAAGDVAQVLDAESGVARLDVLWSSALAEGRAAGRAMAGDTTPYRRPPSVNVTRLGGLTATIIGAVGEAGAEEADQDLLAVTRGDSESWRAARGARAFHERGARSRVRVLVGERAAVGAVVIGDSLASRALCRLVRERTDLSALRPELLGDPEHAVARLVALGGEEPRHAPRA